MTTTILSALAALALPMPPTAGVYYEGFAMSFEPGVQAPSSTAQVRAALTNSGDVYIRTDGPEGAGGVFVYRASGSTASIYNRAANEVSTIAVPRSQAGEFGSAIGIWDGVLAPAQKDAVGDLPPAEVAGYRAQGRSYRVRSISMNVWTTRIRGQEVAVYFERLGTYRNMAAATSVRWEPNLDLAPFRIPANAKMVDSPKDLTGGASALPFGIFGWAGRDRRGHSTLAQRPRPGPSVTSDVGRSPPRY